MGGDGNVLLIIILSIPFFPPLGILSTSDDSFLKEHQRDFLCLTLKPNTYLTTIERNVRKKKEMFLQSRRSLGGGGERQYSCIIMLLLKWDGENINKFISLTLLLNAENSARINNPVLFPVTIKPYVEIVAQRDVLSHFVIRYGCHAGEISP